MVKLVHGVGISEAGEFKRTVVVDGKKENTKEYMLWQPMLQRCYSIACQQKHPTYVGCSVSDDFRYFQRFAKWCQSQVGFNLDSFQMDKDILVRGNKLYSEDTCVFVPRNINMLLTKSDATRGEFPIGVSWDKPSQKYKAQCSTSNGKKVHLGLFTTPEAAHNTYKTFKESLIRCLADEYRSVIDTRVYDALVIYEVGIND